MTRAASPEMALPGEEIFPSPARTATPPRITPPNAASPPASQTPSGASLGRGGRRAGGALLVDVDVLVHHVGRPELLARGEVVVAGLGAGGRAVAGRVRIVRRVDPERVDAVLVLEAVGGGQVIRPLHLERALVLGEALGRILRAL